MEPMRGQKTSRREEPRATWIVDAAQEGLSTLLLCRLKGVRSLLELVDPQTMSLNFEDVRGRVPVTATRSGCIFVGFLIQRFFLKQQGNMLIKIRDTFKDYRR